MLDVSSARELSLTAQGLVEPRFLDAMGHMNVAWYVSAFDRAFDQLFARLGLDPEALKRANASTFAADVHVSYQRELREGDPLRVTLRLLGFDAKRFHFFQEMYHAREGYLAATAEWLILYIDMSRRRVAAMPDALQQRLARILEAHARLPRPALAGRSVGLENRRPT